VDDNVDGNAFPLELGCGATGILRAGGKDEQQAEQKRDQESSI
jgi:hypothetical protein